jgi:hypothetical protein
MEERSPIPLTSRFFRVAARVLIWPILTEVASNLTFFDYVFYLTQKKIKIIGDIEGDKRGYWRERREDLIAIANMQNDVHRGRPDKKKIEQSK